ncbi:hypothetical protein EJ05DRAFT_487879 [Pseudovirgaria hyperparasitica]|uniref:Wax synthase domain-containing protein n=1 Tax=Pseudovirgaria hyperparasitica TaxID=470096 RepID=A0A6A6W3A7_9PEZI|nr:uncharacterized protein EJ05DRAFT_487879 [Pseudovirgaria hyperparasitica]KAF2756077.1 hypothetical protein EJ05DRAFT_487879 [Pseudovirgaria hyperparasitica]
MFEYILGIFAESSHIPLFYLTLFVAFSFHPGLNRAVHREHLSSYAREYGMNNWLVQLCFIYFDWIILASPDKERWHKIHQAGTVQATKADTDEVPQGFFARFWFALRMQFNTRGIGWSHQPEKAPRSYPPGYPLSKFILNKLVRAAVFFFVQDQIVAYLATTPYGVYKGNEHIKPSVGLENASWAESFALCWVNITVIYVSVESGISILNILFVLCGYPVEECLPAFGDIKEMYTVRKSWGTVWHMMMRRQASSIGTWLARDVLRFRKGTFGSRYTQLFAGFLVTGAIHGFAAMLTHRDFSTNREFEFFMSQAVMIFIEDHVIKLGKALGLRPNRFWRLVGYISTIIWFGHSVAIWQSSSVRRGMWVFSPSYDLLGLGP